MMRASICARSWPWVGIGVGLFGALGLLAASFAPGRASAQKATFEDLLADAKPVDRFDDLVRPYVEHCDEKDEELRRQCEGVRAFLQRHGKQTRYAANIDGAVDVQPYQLKTRAFPVVVRACVTCKSTGIEVQGTRAWLGVAPRGELAHKAILVAPEMAKKWPALIGAHLRAQMIFTLNGKSPTGVNGATPFGVEVMGWRVYNDCTGEVLWSEPSSRGTGPSEKAESCPKPEDLKPEPAKMAGPDRRPAKLGRYDIEQVLDAAKPKIKACYEKYEVSGRADVVMDIEGNGRVQGKRVKGTFEGTPTASCLLEALDGIKFPAFRGERQTIEYPFYLR